jgi:hypothetical protein
MDGPAGRSVIGTHPGFDGRAPVEFTLTGPRPAGGQM